MSADNAVFPAAVWTLQDASTTTPDVADRSLLRSARRARVSRVILNGGTIVLPDRLIEGGSVVIEDGRIAGVFEQEHGRSGSRGELLVDTHGRMVMPGLVDLHNDNFETEINPRPSAALPVPLALATLDRRLAASGVTTEFDAIFFADMIRSERKLEVAPQRAAAVFEHSAGTHSLVDHHVLFRIDLWSPESMAVALRSAETASVPLVSLNDHTPGQGQYRDVENLKRYYREQLGRSEVEVEREIARQTDRARDESEIATGVLNAVHEAVRTRDLLVMSHDDDTPDRVDLMYAVGARIGEFPVTLEAARRQRKLGMAITAGAPNLVRGGSTSGNIGARELLAEGLVDVLCADYHAPSLLGAVFEIARSGLMSLPRAVRLVTLNPAQAVRLADELGALEPGKRGDVIVVDPAAPTPVVELAFRRGALSYYVPAARGCLPLACEEALSARAQSGD